MNEFVYIFQYPMMALCVQNFVIVGKILKDTILVKLRHRLFSSKVFRIFILLNTKGHKIRNIVLIHENRKFSAAKIQLFGKNNHLFHLRKFCMTIIKGGLASAITIPETR